MFSTIVKDCFMSMFPWLGLRKGFFEALFLFNKMLAIFIPIIFGTFEKVYYFCSILNHKNK